MSPAVNKSEKVREYLELHPEARPREVAAALKPFKITPAFVSTVKAKARLRDERKAMMTRGGFNDAEPIQLAAKLIRSCGGEEGAQQVIAAVASAARSIR